MNEAEKRNEKIRVASVYADWIFRYIYILFARTQQYMTIRNSRLEIIPAELNKDSVVAFHHLVHKRAINTNRLVSQANDFLFVFSVAQSITDKLMNFRIFKFCRSKLASRKKKKKFCTEISIVASNPHHGTNEAIETKINWYLALTTHYSPLALICFHIIISLRQVNEERKVERLVS